MNKVNTKSVPLSQHSAKDLIGDNMVGHGRTAFVGKCGDGPEHSLHLITYNGIIRAAYPNTTWDGIAPVIVDRFCDVTIKEN